MKFFPGVVFCAIVVGAPLIDEAAAQTDPERDILVTFENRAARASTTGAPYRHRKRYAISADASRQAAAVADDYELEQIDHWPIKALSVYCFVYRVGEDEDRSEVIEKLRDDSRIESVQILQEFETGTSGPGIYDDTYANLQHGLSILNLSAAHRHSLGQGVRIAVIDGHADINHEDLHGRIRTIEDFASSDAKPDRNHGTAVTSVIAASANNAKGIVGVAPESSIELFVACWSAPDATSAVCDTFSLAKAIDTVLENPPHVLNLSLVGPSDPLLHRLLRKAFEQDVIIVAARPGYDPDAPYFPASMDEVLAVGSSLIEDHHPDEPLFAPGEQILVAVPDNAYDFRSGSSLAAAHVSGVVALLLAVAPEARFATIEAALRRSQLQHDTGFFSVDACRALELADPSLRCDI